MDETARLDDDIADFIGKGLDHRDEEGFNALAMREFALQYREVAPYRDYCDGKGARPGGLSSWREIPAVPAAAFKHHRLNSFPLEKAVQENLTSGSTGRKNRGRVWRDAGALALIKLANGLLTRAFLFPDVERMHILFMVPSPQMAPGMGMAIGMEEVRRRFGTPESRFLISFTGLDMKGLVRDLMAAEASGRPLALVGATSGFIYFFRACREQGVRFRLPPGSRVCDGGGYLGQFGDCTREEYLQRCREVLGVEAPYCVNVLGMAESSTNFFDNVLRNHINGNNVIRYKEIPPWTRTLVVDPERLTPLPPGKPGLLRHYDLANRAMVLGVQTDNLGVELEGGFEILGRWSRERGAHVIGYSGGHPGGRFLTQVTDFLMTARMNKIGKLYASMKTRETPHGHDKDKR